VSQAHTPRNEPIPGLGRAIWWAGPSVIWTAGRIAFSFRCDHMAELPTPPFVLAANHYSHFDPPAIGSALRTPIRFLSVDELTGANRFLATILPTVGTIPVSRNRLPIATLRVALARLEAGEVVGVFPEGTRVARFGDLPPKRGAAWLAIRARVPLIPIAVIGTGRALGLDNRLHRAPIRVVVGSALSTEGEDPSTVTDRWADWVSEQIGRNPRSER